MYPERRWQNNFSQTDVESKHPLRSEITRGTEHKFPLFPPSPVLPYVPPAPFPFPVSRGRNGSRIKLKNVFEWQRKRMISRSSFISRLSRVELCKEISVSRNRRRFRLGGCQRRGREHWLPRLCHSPRVRIVRISSSYIYFYRLSIYSRMGARQTACDGRAPRTTRSYVRAHIYLYNIYIYTYTCTPTYLYVALYIIYTYKYIIYNRRAGRRSD